MKIIFTQIMIYMGIALMVLNIYKYVRFSREISARGDWKREANILRLPVILLFLFLFGYIAVALFGHPDLVVAGILFGGSIFVFIMVVLMRRIEHRIQINEHMQAEMEATKLESEAKTRFLANMSHDLRTPMNAIIGYTTLALQKKDIQQDTKEYLEKIDYSSLHLLSLINDILDMNSIESGKMELDTAPGDLTKVMDEVYDIFLMQMQGKHLKYTVDYSGVQDGYAVFDKNRLNRILLNLVSNALKFTPENGEIKVTLTQTGKNDGNADYELRVKDNGIGMSKEFAEHIFEAFERERNKTVSGTQGTGLGMSITKSLVEMMNGTINVQTEKDKGTEFIINLTFPLAAQEDIDELTYNETDKPQTVDFSGKRVLLVEDNPINKEIAVMLLEQFGFEVDYAENGKVGLEMVEAAAPNTYDLVLMDIQMPVMNGYDATRAIRKLDEQRAAIPIIAMSANAFAEDVQEALAAGMNAHIAKPMDVNTMMETISGIIRE